VAIMLLLALTWLARKVQHLITTNEHKPALLLTFYCGPFVAKGSLLKTLLVIVLFILHIQHARTTKLNAPSDENARSNA
ncbi:MAG: hypothetical protein KDK34_15585, partial [Leptospiraceae bacterium]|nr:hypothetical protein [Leptospiraceae bacterium]